MSASRIYGSLLLPLAAAGACALAVGAVALNQQQTAPANLTVERANLEVANPDLPIPPTSYPKWTNVFLFEGHFMFVSGKDATLVALMDSETIVHGTPGTVEMNAILQPGDLAIRGAFENVGKAPAMLMDSYGEMIELEPGDRIVVSDELLYGATNADRGTGTVPPNACICDCGDYVMPMPIPGGQQPPRCDDYNGSGPCIDKINNTRDVLTNCEPGYHSWETEP